MRKYALKYTEEAPGLRKIPTFGSETRILDTRTRKAKVTPNTQNNDRLCHKMQLFCVSLAFAANFAGQGAAREHFFIVLDEK